MNKGIWIYDIENFCNFFSYSAINRDTQEVVQFIIWKQQNDLLQLLDHLKQCGGQVGFNNCAYDYPIIHFLLQNTSNFKKLSGEEIANQIYKEAQATIKKEFSAIRESDVIIPQLDLFLIWHFNNKARMTNLKKLEINMDLDDVQDLPFHHTEEIQTQEQVDKILSYNLHDVKATLSFYEKSRDKISLRQNLQKKYGLNCLNYPDSKIGEQLVLQLYCDQTGQPIEKIKRLRTKRKLFKFIDFIPSYTKFQTPEFNGLLEYLRGIEVKELKDSFKYEFTYNGLVYHFGTGGIHACCKSGIYESNDKKIIVSADVASLYPNLAITLNLYPKHLGEQFSQIYEHEIVIPRLAAKKKGDIILANAFKLSSNAIYGKSNSEYSFLYDPNYTLATTLAGQLALSMLAEMLLVGVPDLQILQINTDGLDARFNIEHKRLYWEICKRWEKITRLQLEFVAYSKQIVRDVNTYISVEQKSGKIKYKGALRPKEIAIKEGEEWHKNFSQDIVVQAVNKFFLEGIPVEKTIKECTNIYSFCKLFSATHGWSCETFYSREVQKNYEATKLFYKNKGYDEISKDFFIAPKNSGEVKNVRIISISDKLTEIQYNIEKQQKTNRYFISNKGKVFRKKKDDKIISIEANVLVTIFNKFEQKENYDINYDYYINEAMKIVETINGVAEQREQERKAKAEQEKRRKEEEGFKKYCLDKIPTIKQLEKWGKSYLIEKYGTPKTKEELKEQEQNVNN